MHNWESIRSRCSYTFSVCVCGWHIAQSSRIIFHTLSDSLNLSLSLCFRFSCIRYTLIHIAEINLSFSLCLFLQRSMCMCILILILQRWYKVEQNAVHEIHQTSYFRNRLNLFCKEIFSALITKSRFWLCLAYNSTIVNHLVSSCSWNTFYLSLVVYHSL